MAKRQIMKLDRDWKDLGLLPKARILAKDRYKLLRQLHLNYLKN